jgi:hypothetical protein
MGATPDALARLQSRLEQGLIAIVPAAAQDSNGSEPLIGWWLYDYQSKALRDEFQNGRHAETAEEMVQIGATWRSYNNGTVMESFP